jgi:hypothetical protein
MIDSIVLRDKVFRMTMNGYLFYLCIVGNVCVDIVVVRGAGFVCYRGERRGC